MRILGRTLAGHGATFLLCKIPLVTRLSESAFGLLTLDRRGQVTDFWDE